MAQTNTNRMYLTLLDETAWGDEGAAGNEALIPVLDGDYNVALEDPIREQQHVVGDQDAFYAVQDVRNLRGQLKVGLWPHLWERLLNWGLTRTAGELPSKATYVVYPSIESRVHAGLKADSVTIEGSQGGDITMSLDLIGRHETTIAEPTYPGTYEIPAIPSLLYKNCRVLLSLDSSGAMENAFLATGVSQFSVSQQNNHKVGPAVEDRADLEKDGVPAFLTAGRVTGEFRCTAAFDRAAFGTLQRSRLYAQMEIVGAHPAYTTTFAVSGAEVAGSNVVIGVDSDPTTDVSVGDYIYIATTIPQVCKVTARAAGPDTITVETLDRNCAGGEVIYLAGFKIKTSKALVSATPVNHPFDDFLTVEVQGKMFSGGAAPVTFGANDMTLP